MIGRYYINFDKQIIDLLSISPSIFHHPLPIPAHRAHQKGPIFSSQVTQHRPTLVEAKAFAIQMVQAQCVLMYLPTKFGKTAHQNVGYYFRIKFCWRLQDYCWFCFFHEILFFFHISGSGQTCASPHSFFCSTKTTTNQPPALFVASPCITAWRIMKVGFIDDTEARKLKKCKCFIAVSGCW